MTQAIAELERTAAPPLTEDWREHLKNVYSQNGEDGIIEEVFRRIGTTNKWCFECGAADGIWFSNTRRLIDEGWNAVLIEADAEKFKKLGQLAHPATDNGNHVIAVNEEITPTGAHSLDAILERQTVFPPQPDLGVIDIDGDDYYVLLNLIRHRPRVLVVEFDTNVPASFVPERGSGKQAGCDAMMSVAAAKGYWLLGVVGPNLILVVNEEVGKITGETGAVPVGLATVVDGPPEETPQPVQPEPTHDGKVRLNLGSGNVLLPGYVNVDKKFGADNKFGPPTDVPAGAEVKVGEIYPLDFPDGYADLVRASHTLEHFGRHETLDVLREWARVLKPGGVLQIAVPDFDKCVDWHCAGLGAQLPIEGYLYGGQVDGDDYHKAMFNEQKLTALLRMAGFGEVQRWASDAEDCARLPVSLNLQGTKGAPEYPNLRGKVAACFSVPRLGFMDNQFSALEAFTKMNIPAIRKSGAFWGACVEGCMELLVDKVPIILTIDYDTVFTADDVLALYRTLERHPEADAVCAVQAGRDRATPLMTVLGPDGKNRATLTPEEMAAELLELKTGHFGLTMIRSAAIKKIPKPWFHQVPDKDGSWGDGRVDQDIWFWLRLKEAGFRLFQANRIVVGHAQLMISYPNGHMETQHIYPSTLEAGGKPEWAWK